MLMLVLQVAIHTLLRSPNPKGTFSFSVPLKHIFGFTGDYEGLCTASSTKLRLIDGIITMQYFARELLGRVK